MRKLILLLALVLAPSSLLQAQTPTPTPSPTQSQLDPDLPKKPSKPPVTADEFYESARWEFFNRRNEAAMDQVNQALKLNPEHVEAFLLRGNMKSRQDDCRGAIDDYTAVINRAERPFNTYQYRGECKVRLGDYPGALRDFDKSVALLNERGQVQYNAFVNRGKVKYILRDYNGASQDFRAAFRMHGHPFAAFYNALTLIKAGNLSAALEDLTFLAASVEEVTRTSRQKYPEMFKEKEGYPYDQNIFAPPPKKEKGVYAFTVGSAASASDGSESTPMEFAEFDDMIVLDNWFFPSKKVYMDLFITDSSEVVFFFLGEIYAGQNDPERAIKAYSAGIASKGYGSGFGRMKFERGKLYLLTGSYEPAVRDFSWAISQRSKLPDVYLERAVALTMMNRDDLAAKDLRSYTAANPSGSDAAAKRVADAKKARALSPSK